MSPWEDLQRRVYFMLRELGLQGRSPNGYVLEISAEKLAEITVDITNTIAAYTLHADRQILGFSFRITGKGNRLALVHEVLG